MFSSFSLFQSHLDLAHEQWKKLLKGGEIGIDATCGNGYDSLILARLLLRTGEGQLFLCDVQQRAIATTKERLKQQLTPEHYSRLRFIHGCHSQFPKEILQETVQLIVYNLGYLPGGDKKCTTHFETTLASINSAMPLLAKGGAMSITCYPGHKEGKREEELLLSWSCTLDPKEWSCCHHRWVNRENSPSLLLLQKANPPVPTEPVLPYF